MEAILVRSLSHICVLHIPYSHTASLSLFLHRMLNSHQRLYVGRKDRLERELERSILTC